MVRRCIRTIRGRFGRSASRAGSRSVPAVSDRPAEHAPPNWDERYAIDGFLFGTAPNQFLEARHALIRPGGHVLCVADGEGRNSVWLAQQGFTVDAFDGSAVAVAKARDLAATRGVAVQLGVADVATWDWPVQRYDAVAAIFVQFAPPELRQQMFGWMHDTLRPGGLLLLEGYHERQLQFGTGGPRVPDQLYTEDQLRTELGAFTIERLDVYDAEVDEGPAHSGMSALVDVVARRRA